MAAYLGFGRVLLNSRFGLSIEGGSYFSTSIKMSLDATKLLSPAGEEIKETFKTWKSIPLV